MIYAAQIITIEIAYQEVILMAVSYNKLWKMLIDKNISKTELTHLAGITTNAMAKLGRNEDVRVKTLEKLCTSLDCKLDDIVEFVPDTKKKEG